MPLPRHFVRLCITAAALALGASPAHALRVVTWNLIQYPNNNLATRQPHIRTVMDTMNADVLIVQELGSAAGRDSLLNNVLNVVDPGQWSAGGHIASTESAIFYKTAKVTVSNIGSFATSGPRDVYQCFVKPVGYASNQAGFRVYSVHLKAGDSMPDTALRHLEASEIRNTINAVPTGSIGPNFMIGGDFNVYRATESCYIRLTESQADNDGRGKDPLLMPGNWNNNSGYALFHTQCPCLTNCLGGYSGGGMDDRFDFWLTAYSMQDNEGLDWTGSSIAGYAAFGNDGAHFNQDINGGGFNSVVGFDVATSLTIASDHLPVVIVLQVPAKVVAASTRVFDTVLVGATAPETLSVSNGAQAPADELTYSYAAPAGFTAPAGTLTVNAGAVPNRDELVMNTATAGLKTGVLTMTTDDPDSATKQVQLSGTVLRHAVASLDSNTVVTAAPADFGDHEAGQFEVQHVRIHNQGYDALQARLSANSGIITGGAGRFSIIGGFNPTLLSGLGTTLELAFDDDGATADSVYEATLTIASTDEPLPGATAASDLVVTLRAQVLSGSTGVPGSSLVLRFERPRPNPLTREARFAFELPAAAPVSLEIFDLGGRRIATLVDGEQDAGHHSVLWQPRNAHGGRLPAGLYLARFRTPGLERMERLVVMP